MGELDRTHAHRAWMGELGAGWLTWGEVCVYTSLTAGRGSPDCDRHVGQITSPVVLGAGFRRLLPGTPSDTPDRQLRAEL